MPKGVFIVVTSCTDPSREEEFNRWYTHTHLPDQSEAFVQARRYRDLTASGKSRYVTIYEYASADVKESIRKQLRIALASFAAGRHIDFIGDENSTAYMLEEIEPDSLEPLDMTTPARRLPAFEGESSAYSTGSGAISVIPKSVTPSAPCGPATSWSCRTSSTMAARRTRGLSASCSWAHSGDHKVGARLADSPARIRLASAALAAVVVDPFENVGDILRYGSCDFTIGSTLPYGVYAVFYAHQGDFLQLGVGKVGVLQLGGPQAGVLRKAGLGQVGAGQVGAGKVGSRQVGSFQVGAGQVGAFQVPVAQVGAGQVGTG